MHENPLRLSRVATLRKRHGEAKNASFQLCVVKATTVFFRDRIILNLKKLTTTATE